MVIFSFNTVVLESRSPAFNRNSKWFKKPNHQGSLMTGPWRWDLQKVELLENPTIENNSFNRPLCSFSRSTGYQLVLCVIIRSINAGKLIISEIRWTGSTEWDPCIKLMVLPKSATEGIKRWKFVMHAFECP